MAMYHLPSKYSETTAAELDALEIKPISDFSQIDECSVDIKSLRSLIKDTQSLKKTAEAPWIAKIHEVEAILDETKTNRKTAIAPYTTVLDKAKELDVSIRQNITSFTQAIEEARLKAIKDLDNALLEADKSKQAAQEALEYARQTGDASSYQGAQELYNRGLEAVARSQELELEIPTVQKCNNVTILKKLRYKVIDITKIPEKFLEWSIDEYKIRKTLEMNFPGIEFPVIRVIDVSLVPDKYTCAIPNDKEVLDYLKSDDRHVIPGIERYYEDGTMVR